MDDLSEILEDVENKAKETNLSIVWGVPLLINYPEIEWEGDWKEYLDLARHVGTALVYIEADKFDLERENISRASHSSNRLERRRRLLFPLEDSEVVWLVQRLMEHTGEWSKYNQKIGHVKCLWFKDSVAHKYELNSSWYLAYSDTVEKVLEEAEVVEEENRQVRTEEEAAKNLQRAGQLARHERFPDASNSEKRLFMAQQLFPDNAEDRLDLTRIVHLAEMIYWWEVEPEMRASKAQKARDLRANGESIKNIAALLKMPEAKVRAAIETVDE